MNKGPVATLTVMAPGGNFMGAQLAQWVLYAATITRSSRATSRRVQLPAGAHYLLVFRVVGATAFMGYALGLWQMVIW